MVRASLPRERLARFRIARGDGNDPAETGDGEDLRDAGLQAEHRDAAASGFTHPTNEFATPYRVINYHTCNSWRNDARECFDHKDNMWCPRYRETPRQFECARPITADQVKDAIHRIPGLGAATAGRDRAGNSVAA